MKALSPPGAVIGYGRDVTGRRGHGSLNAPARLLVADHEVVRAGVRVALEQEVEICCETDDAEEAIRQAELAKPDICLVGWEIYGGGLHAVRGILKAVPSAAVIVVAETTDVDDMLDALRAGAVGYVPGGVDIHGLRRVVRAVAAHEAAVPRSLVRALIGELRAAAELGAQGVTGREAQVLSMLHRGHSTSDIAARLEISPVTVRRHISDLEKKLGVEDRVGLMGLRGGADYPPTPSAED
jgi:DNA-binding NarL/FixJ family response regulator